MTEERAKRKFIGIVIADVACDSFDMQEEAALNIRDLQIASYLNRTQKKAIV